MRTRPQNHREAFTLVELLVVIGIIGLLVAVLLPALSKARESSRRAACLSNLHQIGIAIHAYANENRSCIPFGPKAPPYTATNFYPTMGTVTSLISLENGDPVGLGLMLEQQLASTKRVLFCPGTDQDFRAEAELAKVGTKQAQSDYYYRHGSGSSLYVDATNEHIKISGLGKNSQGVPIRALVMDANYLVDIYVSIFGVSLRTNHEMQSVNVLYSDGHAEAILNSKGELTVDARDNPRASYERILKAFENADRMQ